MDDDARKQNYWVLRAMGFTNTETLLYCQNHRRITLTWEGEPFCCVKAELETKLEITNQALEAILDSVDAGKVRLDVYELELAQDALTAKETIGS